MRRLKIPTSKNLTTGVTRQIEIDPHVYTSVHQWKPVTPERFLALLHFYSTSDPAIDDFGHGEMSSTSFQLDGRVTAVIHYVPKEMNSSVSSPVLMTMEYGGDKSKTLAFASTIYGVEAAE